MENSKRQSPSGCNKRTGRYGPANNRFHAQRTGPRMEIWENYKLKKTMVPPLHQSNVYIKRQLWVWRTQKSNPFLGGINALGVTALQIIRFHAPRIQTGMQIWETSKLSKTQWYRVCTKAMFISKGNSGYGEPKNAFPAIYGVHEPGLFAGP